MESSFSSLSPAEYDENYQLRVEIEADGCPDKVNLSVGVYRDDTGNPWTLPSVKLATPYLSDNHDYIPVEGDAKFVETAQTMLFGPLHHDLRSRLASVQTISGSGACHLGADFLARTLKPRSVWFSDPSWINHPLIWELTAPEVQRRYYPYYDTKERSVHFPSMHAAIKVGAEKGDIVLFQACAHNPTGCDPSREQWAQLADLCEEKGLIPFFDTAYQGFASANPDTDAWPVHHFIQRGTMEVVIAQSFSKNFGLYAQRVGALHLLVHDSSVVPAIRSNLVRLIRAEYSSPPSWGCQIVTTVLQDPKMREQWYDDLATMNARIISVRQVLYDELQRLRTPRRWEHLLHHKGMFSYTGLSPEEVKKLKKNHHIYMFSSGRASMSGLNTANIVRTAQAIDAVVRSSEDA